MIKYLYASIYFDHVRVSLQPREDFYILDEVTEVLINCLTLKVKRKINKENTLMNICQKNFFLYYVFRFNTYYIYNTLLKSGKQDFFELKK